MPQSNNPFKAVLPTDPNAEPDVDPFAVLRVVSEGPVGPSQAKELSNAVSDSLAGESKKAEDAAEVTAGTGGRAVFKKGPMKGMDKQVFFAMLADTLHGLGGGEKGSRFTQRAMDQKLAHDQLEKRKKELQEDREFRAEQNQLQREAQKEGQKSSQTHEERIAQMRIDAASTQQERAAVLEQDMLKARTKEGVKARLVDEVVQDISLLDDFRLPEGVTYDMLVDDAELLEQVRREAAPAKRRLIFAKIEAQQSGRAAEQQRQLFGDAQHSMDLWMQGLDPVSEAEQAAMGVFDTAKAIMVRDPRDPNKLVQRGSARESAIADTVATGEEKLASPVARKKAREEFVDESWLDYVKRHGKVLRNLDGKLQTEVENQIRSTMGTLWDREATATLNNLRNEKDKEAFEERMGVKEPAAQPSKQRAAEAALSFTGGTQR